VASLLWMIVPVHHETEVFYPVFVKIRGSGLHLRKDHPEKSSKGILRFARIRSKTPDPGHEEPSPLWQLLSIQEQLANGSISWTRSVQSSAMY